MKEQKSMQIARRTRKSALHEAVAWRSCTTGRDLLQ